MRRNNYSSLIINNIFVDYMSSFSFSFKLYVYAINYIWFLSLAARSHVNRMCMAAEIPLIESGSAGYLGQATVYKRVRKYN